MLKNTNNYISQLFGIENKTILLTGSCGQLGEMIYKGFLNAGANVIATDIKIDKRKKISNKNIDFYSLDITDEGKIEEFFNYIYENHSSIDVLINNAGVGVFTPFENRTGQEFDWVSNVNLKGTFLMIKNYYQNQKINMKGNIINIASIYGLLSPDPKIYEVNDRKSAEVYGATKAGVIQMTKYFSVHLAENNFRVNSISPGGVFNPIKPQNKNFIKKYSDRNPMKRMANDEEILGGLFYLASNASNYVTGHNLIIDGGMSSW